MNKEELKLSEEWIRIIYWMIFIVFILLIIAFILSIPKFRPSIEFDDNTVVNIIDGDTFEYYEKDLNKFVKVRLLCVDTPEKGEEGYENATAYLKSLILYQEVILNSSITDKDRYGRLLRYVYTNTWGEDIFVNKLILDSGYGELMVIPPETCEGMFNNSSNLTNSTQT